MPPIGFREKEREKWGRPRNKGLQVFNVEIGLEWLVEGDSDTLPFNEESAMLYRNVEAKLHSAEDSGVRYYVSSQDGIVALSSETDGLSSGTQFGFLGLCHCIGATCDNQ